MSDRKMPVGYRPRESAEPAARRIGCGLPAKILVLLVVLAGVGFYVFDLAHSLIEQRPTEPVAGTQADSPDHSRDDAAEPADQEEDGAATRRATLDSGQVIEGDFEIVGIEDHLAAGNVWAAMAVAIEKDPEALRRLLADGVDPNHPITYGDSDYQVHPLEKAARQGSWETFRILLEAGADPDGAGSSGGTALHWSAARGRMGYVEALLRAGADPDRLSVASRMLEDATPEERWEKAHVGATPLEAAASHGHREVVERLLRAGARPRFALHAASYSGSVELIEFLLRRGADPRREGPFGNGPIRHAVMNGHLAAVERLLEAGARPGEQALREAASNGLDDALRAMAAHGVRFDGPPTYWGPLYAAAAAGNASTVELLLELGASTETFEDQGRPIDVAREKGHDDVVALLEGR